MLRVELLGRLRVIDEAGADVPIRSRAGRALLVLLLLTREPLRRDWVASLLWSDRPENQARASLRQCLLDVRKALGVDVFEGGRTELALRPGVVTSDLSELLAAVAADEVAQIAATTIAEDVSTGTRFDEWLARARLQTVANLGAAIARYGSQRPLQPADLVTRYVEARDALLTTSFDAVRKASDVLEDLVRDVPDFLPPYGTLASIYNSDYGYTRAGASGPRERERALALARASIARDPSFSHGRTALGWCEVWRSEWDAAEKSFDAAIACSAGSARRVIEASLGLAFAGAAGRARALLEHVLPSGPSSQDLVRRNLAFVSLLEGDVERARKELVDVTRDEVWTALFRAMTSGADPRLAAHLVRLWPPRGPSSVAEVTAWIEDHVRLRDDAARARFVALATTAVGAAVGAR